MIPLPVLGAAARAAVGAAVLLGAAAPALRAQQSVTLEEAIALGLSRGHQANAAAATREAARYRNRQLYSRLLPQLSLSADPSYNRRIIEVVQPDGSTLFRPQDQTRIGVTATLSQPIPFTGGDVFVSSDVSRLGVAGQSTTTTWQSTPFSIGLRQPILRPNTLGWDKKEQPIRLDLAERQFLEAREDIAINIVNLFFDVYAAKVDLGNATTNVAVNDTLYRLNTGRYEVGRIGENDLLQSELVLLRARNSLDAARLDYERTLAALRVALNLPVDAPIDLVVTDSVPTFDPDTAVAVSEALRNRAAIANADLQDVQARRRVTEAKLNTGIGATLQATYGYNTTAPEASLVYQNLQEARQLSLSIEVPLWQWGAHKEGVEAAKLDHDAVQNTNEATHNQVRQDAYFAALQLSQARRGLALSAKADTVAAKRYEVAYNRYVIGRISIDNLFIAQAEKDQALAGYVQALRGYWQAYYRLRRMTLYDFEAGHPIY